jgi:hypothetical protein
MGRSADYIQTYQREIYENETPRDCIGTIDVINGSFFPASSTDMRPAMSDRYDEEIPGGIGRS